MGIIKRQSLKFSLISFGGLLIGGLSTLFLYPRVLEAYGLQQFLMTAAITLFPFAVLGGHLASVRYFPEYKDSERGHHGFLGVMLSLTAVGSAFVVLISLLFWPWIHAYFTEKQPELRDYLAYAPALVVVYAFCYTLYYYAMNFHRIAFPSLLMDLGLKIVTVALMIAYLQGWIGLGGLLNGLFLYFFVCFFALLYFVKKLGGFGLRFDLGRLWQLLRSSMGSYMVFGALGGFGYLMAMQGGSMLLVGTMEGMEKTAVFSIAAFLSTVMDIPLKGLVTATSAKVAEYWAKDDMLAMGELYSRASITLLIPGLFLFLAIWVSIDSFFAILPNSAVLLQGKYVFFFLGLGKLTDMALGMSNYIVYYSKYYLQTFWVMLALGLANIALNLWLIPRYGIVGGAIATALCMVAYNLANLFIVYRKTALWPLASVTWKALAVGTGAYFLAAQVPHLTNLYLDIVLRSGLFTLFFVVGVLGLRLSPDLNDLVKKYVGKH